MGNHEQILRKWQLLSPYLNRHQRSLWAAAEAEAIGYGGCVLLSRVTGLSAQTIATRRIKLKLTNAASAGSLVSQRRPGRLGRKRAEVKDPGIVPALERMLSDEVAGDPMSQQKWVRSSIRNLSKKLKEQGRQVGHGTVARLLRKMGYSLQVNKKKQAGSQHPERDQQFRYIATLKSQFLREGLPVISIDTKKKELIGNYRREGKSWRRKPIETDSYFAGYAKCVAVPFGIYDVTQNVGYVTVGISHNTAEFAVNCIASWWKLHGRSIYAQADRVLILADGGGGNGYNLRTWKKDLQDKLCDACGLTVTLSHYPPACSKWNPVEYRLFSHISMNWAGQPLLNLDVMLAFIRGTTTTAGLKVEAYLDQLIYRKGRKVTNQQLKELALSTHDICPRWNYTLAPRLTRGLPAELSSCTRRKK
jgi:Rhodopirellula transposase DDE domain